MMLTWVDGLRLHACDIVVSALVLPCLIGKHNSTAVFLFYLDVANNESVDSRCEPQTNQPRGLCVPSGEFSD